MRRIAGIILAVLLIGGVAVAVVAGRDEGTSTATKTVRAVIGSEKAEFFADPEVVEALAAKGYTVKAETSGSWAMEGLDLEGYDLALPSSQAPAVALAAKYKVTGTLPRPFYSPLVVVAHRNAAEVLASNGLATLDEAHRGTLKMDSYLDAARKDRTWQELKGAGKYGELTGTLYLSSTDPQTSNSGALYLAAASYVDNGGKVVAGDGEVDRAAPLLNKLVRVQGAQQSSSDAAFRDFVSGAGNPLVVVYESQVASLLADGQKPDDLVVLYPDTTVNSDHTVVPLTEEGKAVAELLAEDETLRALEVRHGFRPQGGTPKFADGATYLKQELTGVHQAAVPTSKVLHELARRARA
ncbi:substrate-binding domain-containing protein [Streptomyces sp. TRM66268-LWL]|uniref:Substrate-binding domain-containing protein n=1 Tax=Streptomyces polyasparticus TaxID=2767826 RepID=A0ABR7SKI3_9ACTN|nr:substrate-binding domain-containing protein [Streptomyces polyasparticus]MBC9715980.1 substrate-binding domain-containing protein [Streptomyces polyasparticus]